MRAQELIQCLEKLAEKGILFPSKRRRVDILFHYSPGAHGWDRAMSQQDLGSVGGVNDGDCYFGKAVTQLALVVVH